MFPGAFQTLPKKLTVMAARGPHREKTLTKREGERNPPWDGANPHGASANPPWDSENRAEIAQPPWDGANPAWDSANPAWGERKSPAWDSENRAGTVQILRGGRTNFAWDSAKIWAAQSGGEDCAAARMEENVKRIDPDAVWRPTRGPAQRDANQARKRHGEADPFNRYKNILTYAVHLIKRFVFRCRRLATHVIILKKVQRILETSTGHP